MSKKTIVIIPTFDEAENIEIIINQICNLNLDCLIIDDGSPDGTSNIVKCNNNYGKNVFLIDRGSKKGYASACVEGFDWAIQNNYYKIVQMDADLSHSVDDLKKLLFESDKFDLVIGSRYVNGGQIIGWSYFRLTLSKYANKFAKFILRTNILDLTSGFRIYKVWILQSIGIKQFKSEGYGFLVEILNEVIHKNYSIKEIPILFNDRQFGKSKMSIYVIFDGFKNLLRIGFKNYF